MKRQVYGFSFENETVVHAGLDESSSRRLIEKVLHSGYVRDKVFRDNRRTLSVAILFDEAKLMLKVPRARNQRIWERLLTLFRGSDVHRVFRHSTILRDLGFNVPDPVLVYERRKLGFVVDSFFCYRFVEGRRPDSRDAALVLHALRSLHNQGFVRNDAQLANFLVSGDGDIVFIDFRLKRPRFLPALSKARELDRFVRSCPDGRSLLTPGEASSLWFRLAHALENLSFARRRWKRYFRERRKSRAGQRS